MSKRTPSPRVYSIPPGAPFLRSFAAEFLAGKLIPGFPASDGALELAKATIFVPTRRAGRALARELAAALDTDIALLPRILPLGDVEALEAEIPDINFFNDARRATADSVGEIERRLVLGRLVLKWAEELQHAIVSIDSSGKRVLVDDEALLVTTAPAQAWHLAGDLAGLLDEMIIEEIPWSRLSKIVPDEFDKYWGITLEFLKIAAAHWPAYLAQNGLIDRAERRVRLIEAAIGRIEASASTAPVIAIGSTGTNRATARLLAAIARAPMGAVVLPGLDKTLDDSTWNAIGGGDAREIAATHPQAALHRLLPLLGVTREAIAEIGRASNALVARRRFVSEALRPADTTDLWNEFRQGEDAALLPEALQGITVIEAGDEREEALCLAISIRRVLDRDDATVALITPDRDLSRRVRSELKRWNIEAEDSAGERLGATPLGSLARLILEAASAEADASNALALLSHPLTHLGYPADEITRLANLLDLAVFRTILPDSRSPDVLIDHARAAADGRDAHPAVAGISDADWKALHDLLNRYYDALNGLQNDDQRAPLAAWVNIHRGSLAAITKAAETGYSGDADVLLDAFEEIERSAASNDHLSFDDYRGLFNAITQELAVRETGPSHPRVSILGLLEARLLHADVALMGGLDETIWPPSARTDAFLNRQMRLDIGLSSPDRRIGQTAHDFAEALGAEEVIITRARKRGGSPTVPSRFLQRMAALAGTAAWESCRLRGDGTIALARAIDAAPIVRVGRPEPRPPLHMRPTSLSVTRIETLRRDPYAIYAERILKLVPLSPIGTEPGAREAGNELHDILATFTLAHPAGPLPSDAATIILGMVERKFARFLENPAYRSFQWPRLSRAVEKFVEWDSQRRLAGGKITVECAGRLALTLEDGSTFHLTGRADRIEQLVDGTVAVIDFKTGRVPSKNEVSVGFAPQLPLEAVMIARGAFRDIAATPVSEALYVKIGGPEGIYPCVLGKKENFDELMVEQFEGLKTLLNQFRHVETPYIPRPFPQFANRFGAYDHLARVKEWSSESGDNQ